jgi:hypothetical protein
VPSLTFSTLSAIVPFTEYPVWAEAPSAKKIKTILSKIVYLMVGDLVVGKRNFVDFIVTKNNRYPFR